MTDTSQKPNITLIAASALVGIALGALGVYFIGGAGRGADPVVAEYGSTKVRASEAFGPIKTRLYDLEDEVYRTKEQAINDLIEQRLLEAESKKQNMAPEQLLDKETGGQTAPITDKEIDDFLTSKGLTLNDPRIHKDDVRDYLRYRQRFEQRQAYVAKLKDSAHVKLLIAEPQSPKMNVATDGYPSWGNPKAPVTIIEFSDFQCPFCSKAVPVLNQIKQVYGQDKVHIVYRYMPLPSHNRAMPAAIAAQCANDQGKFWEMHDDLFNNQAKLEDGDLKDYAKQLGLDMTKFNDCFDGKHPEATIERSKREAETLGIQATPSFLINGNLMQGAQPFEKFKEKIDRAASGKT